MKTVKELETEIEVLKSQLAIEKEKNLGLSIAVKYSRQALVLALNFLEKTNDLVVSPKIQDLVIESDRVLQPPNG